MKNETRIVSYTAEDLIAMRERGEDRTDWERAKAMTEAELEAAIASDPDEAGMVVDWSKAGFHPGAEAETAMTIHLDPDVLTFFRSMGRDCQTTINTVLRAYMDRART